MPLLKDSFDELMGRVRQGRDFDNTSFEPVYYLIFPPEKILEVKREMPAWTARLKNDGFEVHIFSVTQEVTDILQKVPKLVRDILLRADGQAPTNWKKTNDSLIDIIAKKEANNGALKIRLEKRLGELEGRKNAILLVTDLEGLHPYVRIGTIEGQLQGKFSVPTVFFYPGERTGKTRLKFLGFYPDDGNYRSVHIGG
jgi:hypothetical protein